MIRKLTSPTLNEIAASAHYVSFMPVVDLHTKLGNQPHHKQMN